MIWRKITNVAIIGDNPKTSIAENHEWYDNFYNEGKGWYTCFYDRDRDSLQALNRIPDIKDPWDYEDSKNTYLLCMSRFGNPAIIDRNGNKLYYRYFNEDYLKVQVNEHGDKIVNPHYHNRDQGIMNFDLDKRTYTIIDRFYGIVFDIEFFGNPTKSIISNIDFSVSSSLTLYRQIPLEGETILLDSKKSWCLLRDEQRFQLLGTIYVENKKSKYLLAGIDGIKQKLFSENGDEVAYRSLDEDVLCNAINRDGRFYNGIGRSYDDFNSIVNLVDSDKRIYRVSDGLDISFNIQFKD